MARKSVPLKLIFAVGKATYKAGLAASREADKRAKANSAAVTPVQYQVREGNRLITYKSRYVVRGLAVKIKH